MQFFSCCSLKIEKKIVFFHQASFAHFSLKTWKKAIERIKAYLCSHLCFEIININNPFTLYFTLIFCPKKLLEFITLINSPFHQIKMCVVVSIISNKYYFPLVCGDEGYFICVYYMHMSICSCLCFSGVRKWQSFLLESLSSLYLSGKVSLSQL